MAAPALVWFRRDLRISDLPTLSGLAQTPTLCVFVLDPRLEASSGPRRLGFLFDSLRELNAAIDGRLLVVRGRPEERLCALARDVGATTVYVSQDFSPFGRRRDAAVAAALDGVGATLTPIGSPYLVSPGRVLKSDGTPYKVFTPYLRRWHEAGWRSPARTTAADADVVDPDEIGGSERITIPDSPVTLSIPAGETAALERWAEFVDSGVAVYDSERDRPDLDSSSYMSAYLKFGNIHPRTMAVDLAGDGPGPRAYLRELAFRDFYADVLYHWPQSRWRNWNSGFDGIALDTDDGAAQRFEAWKAGRTGYAIVDAGMRQLAQTGFMHNRVRMITASFLVKDLHLPWWWGARWFLEQLIDGDIASNSHGWQWAAGTGTDAAPYFRVFNPRAQAAKFDPRGDYLRRWVPEYGSRAYPEPIVDHQSERAEALRRYGEL